ncbi:MAG: hypothetical protein ACRCRX_07585, partial [Pseudolactococcus raffinolactis]
SQIISWFKVYESKRTRKASHQARPHFCLLKHEKISENDDKERQGESCLFCFLPSNPESEKEIKKTQHDFAGFVYSLSYVMPYIALFV